MSYKKSVFIGRKSFLASCFQERYASNATTFLDARDPELPIKLKNADVVVNFAFDPKLSKLKYDQRLDIDAHLASLLKGTATRYVTFSTRCVYSADASTPAIETETGGEVGVYGTNKRIIENRLIDTLGDRLLILRLSNIVGYEFGRARRTFMAMMQDSLREESRVYFNQPLSTRKDFLPAPLFADALDRFVQADVCGVYNLGSGIPLPCGDVIASLLEKHSGADVVLADRQLPAEEFWLSMEKSSHIIEYLPTSADILLYIKTLGERLLND
ncbi:NAD-dependent epimerase/dehydratase family protein [Roseibium algae]|uniref:NAD-dependent epimerase/dehydratase family protein n=1 Tax=Roseibium algae TaxID=3123038 RepID=A0ABU8TS40_9HYPH